jgi:tRNA A37 N6-isopentenylltransferase MiaA
LLTENLAVLARAPPSTPQQARVQLNLWQVLNALYLRPISELTNRYHADRRLVRILDLYFLTGDELSRTHACGPKTIERLDFVLHAKGLPGIDEVVK